jgi:poly(hydroxyalkanoate) depolymerase family esterase
MPTATFRNAAGSRSYSLYLPPNHATRGLPLVVMLHGCKQDPEDFAAGTRMNRLADELGFAVVYPAQSARANVSRCWNWFQPVHQQREGEPSLIAGITRSVVRRHGLNARRVYVAGLSAGGAMAAVMGNAYPELYAAMGIHSGLGYAVASDVTSAFAAMQGKGARSTSAPVIPMIVFHGDGDTTVHPSNGEHTLPGTRQQVEKGSARGRAFTRTVHRDAEERLVLEHWLVHGAGHAWFGGSTSGSYADPSGPDASREMLRFFMQV